VLDISPGEKFIVVQNAMLNRKTRCMPLLYFVCLNGTN
jgi:hypothetical protein